MRRAVVGPLGTTVAGVAGLRLTTVGDVAARPPSFRVLSAHVVGRPDPTRGGHR